MTPEPISREQLSQMKEDVRKWIGGRLIPEARIFFSLIQNDTEVPMVTEPKYRRWVRPIIEGFGWTAATAPGDGYILSSRKFASAITRHSVVKTQRTIKRESHRIEMTYDRWAEDVTTEKRVEIEADRQWVYGLATVTHATALSEETTERVKRTRRRMPAPPPPISEVHS